MHETGQVRPATFSSCERTGSRNGTEMCHGASMNSQGWFIGSNDELLFWVPPYLRPCSLLTDTMLVIPWPWVDVSHLIRGQEWVKINDGNLATS